MQDRKNGGERMEAVLLGLTPEVRVSDRQSPLAGALRREPGSGDRTGSDCPGSGPPGREPV